MPQLFTVGLYALNRDGTYVLDDDGELINTYSNEHIMAFARVWTGYLRQATRKNVETRGSECDIGHCFNDIDPNYLDPTSRDPFPKINLYERYLVRTSLEPALCLPFVLSLLLKQACCYLCPQGDGYPLCTDHPERAFLRVGAKYRFIGPSDSDRPPLGDSGPYPKRSPRRLENTFQLYNSKDPFRDDYVDMDGRTRTGWFNRTTWMGTPNLDEPRFVLNPVSSALYVQLCGGVVDGECAFPLEVTLTQNLACDGMECEVDTLRTLQVTSPNGQTTMEYEYVRPPCVELSFFNDAKVAEVGRWWGICMDPATIGAGSACCHSSQDGWYKDGHHQCNYFVERVSYATAEQRCSRAHRKPPPPPFPPTVPPLPSMPPFHPTDASSYPPPFWRDSPPPPSPSPPPPSPSPPPPGIYPPAAPPMEMCSRFNVDGFEGCGFAASADTDRTRVYVWTSRACQVSVQVTSEPAGWVGIVHSQDAGTPHRAQFQPHSGATFPVLWADGTYPTPDDGCFTGNATADLCVPDINLVTRIATCSCTAVTNTSAVFTNATTEALPSAEEIIDLLAIGSVPPDAHDTGTYSRCTTSACSAAAPDVIAHLHSSGEGNLDVNTIFEVQINGTTSYLLNKVSTIELGAFSFRNPVHFVSFTEPARRDAMYETDALIDHFFYHPNTAPFIAYRLIQRLVTSNPSPRYVAAVTDAFMNGSYASRTYSGVYGDLGAAMSAILLDREARSLTLDLDPAHGGLREPLIKLLHFMRAMEFSSKDGREVELQPTLIDRMGQMAFKSPSVFNFYRPEYAPTGPVTVAELVSPEAQLGTAPWVVGFFNGLSSLIHYGLTNCHAGFGSTITYAKQIVGGVFPPMSVWQNCNGIGDSTYSPPKVGAIDGTSTDGELEFLPTRPSNSTAVVDELDILLTAGRLSATSRAVIEAEYERMLNGPTHEYIIATSGSCSAWRATNIETLEECTEAATFTQGLSSPPIQAITAVDDTQSAHRSRPLGCYWTYWNELKFNVAQNNLGSCDTTFDCICKKQGEQQALKRAQELIAFTPEFHAANEPTPANEPRPARPEPESGGRPYKALIVLFLAGGMDSWNLLVPHSGCWEGNFSTNYEQYERIRGIAAIPKSQLLPITAPNDTQSASVCLTYGLHPSLTWIQRLYEDGDAAFLANTGTLIQPLTRTSYANKHVPKPPSLFAHNIQVRCTQSVHAQDRIAKGVLGRMVDVLIGADGTAASPPPPNIHPPAPPPPPPYRVGAYSLAGIQKMLDGSRPPTVLDSTGAVRYGRFDTLSGQVANLTAGRLKSVFAETFADMTAASLRLSETVGSALDTVVLQSTRWTDTNGDGRVNSQDTSAPHSCTTGLCKSFQQVAKVIAARDVLQEERQVFYLEQTGFDTHASALDGVRTRMEAQNAALTAFVDELKLRGVWNDTVIMTASDFARTLDSNGAGTDHAWGGNYLLLGGGVRGGTIYGKYPTSFLDTSDVAVGRGRFMPTTSWEGVWHALGEWFGVTLQEMASVVPNLANFNRSSEVFGMADLFTTAT